MALTTVSQHVVSVNAIQGTLIADNAITAVHIATNAVSGTLIADNAVTATHIAHNTITVTQLADDAVEADKIADGVITTNHLNKAMISSQTEVTPVAGDFVLIGDTSDSNNLKKTPISGITALATVSGISSSADATAITIGSDEVVTFSKPTTSDGHTSSVATIFEANANGDTVPVQLKVKANNGTTSTQGLYGNAGSASTDNTITLGTNGTTGICVLNSGKAIIGDIASHVDDLLQIETPASGGGHGIQIRRNDSNGDQGIGRVMFGNNNDTDLATMQVTTDGQADCARIGFFVQPTSGSSTERMRIKSGGEVIVGSTAIADTYTPLVTGLTSDALVVGRHSTSGSLGLWRSNTMEFKYYHNGMGYVMTFASNGVISGDFNDTSDINLKENISSISDGTTVIKALRPVKFDWKASGKGNNQHGFIAQEVETVLPDAVEGNDYVENETGLPRDEPAGNGKTMNSNAVLAHAVKAIQELEERIKTLEG